MNCLSCENYIPLDPPIQRTDAQGQTYTVPGLSLIHISEPTRPY